MPELILVTPEECRPLRLAVLHPGAAATAALYPNDDDERSTHYCMKKGKQVLACISLLHEPLGEIGSEMWRVRGLAVRPEQQRSGLGSTLLETAKAIAGKRGGGAWALVDAAAAPFFEAHGFRQQAGLPGAALDAPGASAVRSGPPRRDDERLMTWRARR